MYFDELHCKITDGTATCGAVGLGYLGLPLAVEMGGAGFAVLGFDVLDRVVKAVNEGNSHIKDVPASAVRALRRAKMFEATTEMARLAAYDVSSICVQTPLRKTRDPDMSLVIAATESMAKWLRAGQLIVLESTTYAGTTRDLMVPLLKQQGLKVGKDVFLCFSPERVDPDNETWHTNNNPKVIGGLTQECEELAAIVYGKFIDRMLPVSGPEARSSPSSWIASSA